MRLELGSKQNGTGLETHGGINSLLNQSMCFSGDAG